MEGQRYKGKERAGEGAGGFRAGSAPTTLGDELHT